MIKKIIAICMTFMLIIFTGCSLQPEEDKEIAEQLVGMWVPLNDVYANYDEEGNQIAFSVYEFTGEKTNYHYVETPNIMSWEVNEYEIKNGRYYVYEAGMGLYQDIYFTDEGNLVLASENEKDVFRRMSQEEIDEYHIPVGLDLGDSDETEATMAPEAAETASDTAPESAATASETATEPTLASE